MAKPNEGTRQPPATGRKRLGESQDSRETLRDVHRSLPHSKEAELGLLAAMAIAPDKVTPEIVKQFGYEGDALSGQGHTAAFSALVSLWKAHTPIDEISLRHKLESLGTLADVGGQPFVDQLFNFIPNTSAVGAYAEIVEEKALRRQVINEATPLISRAYESTEDASGLISDLERVLLKLTRRKASKKARSIREIVGSAVHSLSDPETALGISTGYPTLDKVVGGLPLKAKIVLAGKTSSGKSAFAHNIAVSLAVKRKIPTAYFSFEMSDEQTALRMIQTHSEVSVRRLVRGETTEMQNTRFGSAAERVAGSPLFIVNERIDIAGIEAHLMQLVAEHGVRVAIIDYLQIVPEKKQKGENQTEKLDRMSAETKQMAHHLDITILELSQLTELSDGSMKTRGSSAITNDADQFWIVGDAEEPGYKEIAVAKQRDGPKEPVVFAYRDDITRFFEPSKVPVAGK